MYGTIFLYLQKFVRRRSGADAWSRLLNEADLGTRFYSAVQEYPDQEAFALFAGAGRLLEIPVPAFLEEFGEFLAPELLNLYASLIHPEWKTLEVVLNTEDLIHRAVRMRNPGAKPPMLDCVRVGENDVQIMYSSDRRLCQLAKGIVRGLALHYGETVTVADEACMNTGDPFCALLVSRAPPVENQPAQAQEDTGVQDAADTKILKPGDLVCGPDVRDDSFVLTASAGFPFLEPPRRAGELGRLAQYRVLELLGQGSMGFVFRAEDERLERLVALKVMQPSLASDSQSPHRFIREARAMAALKSEHIVTIYEVGSRNDLPFLAMEFMEGESLDVYQSEKGRMPLLRVLRTCREIAEGLALAHAKGFIHRDIKPSNLWLEAPTGRVKILDFGLAKTGTEMVHLSQAGSMIGTPAFMAPEQARGEIVDHRADLFSLGCVMYWLCTNELPFKGKDVLSVLMALATKEPTSPVELRPDLPPRLSELILELLEKDPARRPASSRAVVDALAALENGQEMLSMVIDAQIHQSEIAELPS